MAVQDTHPTGAPLESTRFAGIVLAAGAVALVTALANHPESAASKIGEILRDAVASRGADNLVHGTGVAVMVIFTYGFATLARSVGLDRPTVLMALVAYAFGAVLASVSFLADGFATADYAQHLLAHGPAMIDIGLPSLLLLGALIQVATKAGFMLLGVGVFVLSIPLAMGRGLSRVTGLIGFACSLVPLGAAAFAGSAASAMTVAFLVLGLAIWNGAAALLLICGTAGRPRASSRSQRALEQDRAVR
jgi:hypothetical protein